eukprot:c48554_g1_i1 orf=3-329(-)
MASPSSPTHEAMAMHPTTAFETPHAIVFPFPSQGHLNPMMHFSKILASKGFVITFVTLEFQRERIMKTGQHEAALEAGFDIRLEGLSDGLPPHHPREPDAAFMLAVDNL